jgi:hypothetical protein
LALPFKSVDGVVHLLVEAEVQHAVALIQHEVFAYVHVQALLVQVII